MKIEKISDNKIKVLIDDQEAKEWNISFKNISENTPEVQEMFWTAIRLAEKNVDFSVEGAKLFVEAVPGAEKEGFGMLITRVCNDAELQTAIGNCGYKGRLKKTELKYPQRKNGRKYIFRFESFEAVCAAADVLADFYCGSSVLYKLSETFYLYLLPETPEVIWSVGRIMPEFGSRVKNGQYMLGRLNEYGEIFIAEDAVTVLKKYFCVR